MKTLALLWGPFGFRMDELAEAVGGKRASITVLYGPRYFAPLRYLALFIRTLFLLAREKPDVVYAQNPPIFCPLTCLLYCRISGARLVVDHHSVWKVKTLGGSPISRMIGMLEGVVARAAAGNTVPHGVWKRALERMGARGVVIVHDYVPKNPLSRDYATRAKYAPNGLIAIAGHGGHPLERVECEAAAIGKTKGVTLLLTGPLEKLRSRVEAVSLPGNVRFLGFLPRAEYESLKASADFAINVTDEPFTLSHVLFEYAASSIPIISSRQSVVEDVFDDSVLYVGSSSAAELAEKVTMMADKDTLLDYKTRITLKYDELERARKAELALLRSAVFG